MDLMMSGYVFDLKFYINFTITSLSWELLSLLNGITYISLVILCCSSAAVVLPRMDILFHRDARQPQDDRPRPDLLANPIIVFCLFIIEMGLIVLCLDIYDRQVAMAKEEERKKQLADEKTKKSIPPKNVSGSKDCEKKKIQPYLKK